MPSDSSTRPETTWTSTSPGPSVPSATCTRSSSELPSSWASAGQSASTCSTRTAGQASRTFAFHTASSRAAVNRPLAPDPVSRGGWSAASSRWASAAGAYSRSTYSRTIRPASTLGPRVTRVCRTMAIQWCGSPSASRS